MVPVSTVKRLPVCLSVWLSGWLTGRSRPPHWKHFCKSQKKMKIITHYKKHHIVFLSRFICSWSLFLVWNLDSLTFLTFCPWESKKNALCDVTTAADPASAVTCQNVTTESVWVHSHTSSPACAHTHTFSARASCQTFLQLRTARRPHSSPRASSRGEKNLQMTWWHYYY